MVCYDIRIETYTTINNCKHGDDKNNTNDNANVDRSTNDAHDYRTNNNNTTHNDHDRNNKKVADNKTNTDSSSMYADGDGRSGNDHNSGEYNDKKNDKRSGDDENNSCAK